MASKNTYRILIWIVVILLATNLSMGLSFWFHKQQDKKGVEAKKQQIEMPTEQRTKFFREQLNLRQDQMDTFRELSRSYNRSARRVTNQLEAWRLNMVEIMGEQNPDKEELKTITENIGRLHAELKELTIEYYLSMKAECDEDQQMKLNEIFISMSKSKEDVSLPQRGGRHRGR
jgi:Spy/CpxP family protein refolding chaperone